MTNIGGASLEVLEAIEKLVDEVRERSVEAEQRRQLPEANADGLRKSGLMRLLQPARYGGLEGDPRVLYESVMRLGAACGSTGWVAGVVGIHSWQLALFDDKLQEEIWGENPDAWASSSYMPGGKLTEVDGGFEVSGRWSFSSGCDHCGWAILGALLPQEDGPPTIYNIVVPRSDYVIEDTWHVVGLCGTGSNDIVIDRAFVPAHRTLTKEQVYAAGNAPGCEVNTNPLYKMPFASVFSNVITAPIIGMAEGVLALSIEHTRDRVSNAHGRIVDNNPYAVSAIGEAAREIDACRTQLLRNIGDLYDTALAGGEITLDQRARTRRDQVLGTERAVAAIDALFGRAGAKALHNSHPMQRLWRDSHAAKQHTVNTNEKTLHSWAQNAMGLGPSDSII